MKIIRLPGRFFLFPWSYSKLKLTLLPAWDHDPAKRFWSLAWMGFEIGQTEHDHNG